MNLQSEFDSNTGEDLSENDQFLQQNNTIKRLSDHKSDTFITNLQQKSQYLKNVLTFKTTLFLFNLGLLLKIQLFFVLTQFHSLSLIILYLQPIIVILAIWQGIIDQNNIFILLIWVFVWIHSNSIYILQQCSFAVLINDSIMILLWVMFSLRSEGIKLILLIILTILSIINKIWENHWQYLLIHITFISVCYIFYYISQQQRYFVKSQSISEKLNIKVAQLKNRQLKLLLILLIYGYLFHSKNYVQTWHIPLILGGVSLMTINRRVSIRYFRYNHLIMLYMYWIVIICGSICYFVCKTNVSQYLHTLNITLKTLLLNYCIILLSLNKNNSSVINSILDYIFPKKYIIQDGLYKQNIQKSMVVMNLFILLTNQISLLFLQAENSMLEELFIFIICLMWLNIQNKQSLTIFTLCFLIVLTIVSIFREIMVNLDNKSDIVTDFYKIISIIIALMGIISRLYLKSINSKNCKKKSINIRKIGHLLIGISIIIIWIKIQKIMSSSLWFYMVLIFCII